MNFLADDANNNEVQLYEEPPPTPYDLRCLEKIKRNKHLQSLGLGNNTPKQETKSRTKGKTCSAYSKVAQCHKVEPE